MDATPRFSALVVRLFLLGCGLVVMTAGCGPTTPTGRGGGGAANADGDGDGDGLTDAEEARRGTDPALADSDGDGLSDGEEVALGTSPLARDSDGDGLEDGQDPQPTVPADEPTDQNDNETAADQDNANDNSDDDADPDHRISEAEPNDDFDAATAAGLGEPGTLTLLGSIDQDGDLDLFDLGALVGGDHVTATLVSSTGSFDPLAVLFCHAHDIVAHTDDLDSDQVADGLLLDEVLRYDAAHHYLVITHGAVLAEPGDYEITVAVERGGEVPAPAGQIVYLNFAGGTVNDPTLGEVELGPFDAADIDPAFENDTGTIKSAIIQTVIADFEGYDLTLLESDTDDVEDLPATESVSMVYFGGFSRPDFSVSDGFDPYNRNPSDRAIIYTDSFGPDVFDQAVEAGDVGTAIGTRVSFELGLMLGLRPVDGPGAIMVDVTDPDDLLEERSFTTAPLAEEVFPIGQQDAELLLSKILGE